MEVADYKGDEILCYAISKVSAQVAFLIDLHLHQSLKSELLKESLWYRSWIEFLESDIVSC